MTDKIIDNLWYYMNIHTIIQIILEADNRSYIQEFSRILCDYWSI
jgi:hypothetical protein